MNTEQIKNLGERWKILDDRYDAIIQGLIDNPVGLTNEKLLELKQM